MPGTARTLPTPPTPTGRLTSPADIRRVIGARCAAGRDHLVVHARQRPDGGPARATVVAGRRVGGAVVRNRAKRRLRACLRDVAVPGGVDLVVTAKAQADVVPYDGLCQELAGAVSAALRRAGLR